MKIILEISNPCGDDVVFSQDGIPLSKEKDISLKSLLEKCPCRFVALCGLQEAETLLSGIASSPRASLLISSLPAKVKLAIYIPACIYYTDYRHNPCVPVRKIKHQIIVNRHHPQPSAAPWLLFIQPEFLREISKPRNVFL